MLKGLFVCFIFLVAAGFSGNFGLIGMTLAATAVWLLWFLYLAMVVHVPEMHTGVIYLRGSQRFSHFLPEGRHWIAPWREQLKSLIPVEPGSVNGRCEGVQTSGGLPLTIEWTLSYNLNPFRIPASKQAKLARTLPRKSAGAATKHVNNVLRHIFSEYGIDQITQPGFQRRLERQVRQLVAERLAEAGFEISRVMIGVIEMPQQVTASLAAAHQRQLQAENEAQALSRLQKVVSQFSEAEMERLMELERIHMLGQNGVTLMYTTHQPGSEFFAGTKRPSVQHPAS